LKTTIPGRVYQLKVSLKYFRPTIWRRIEVPSDLTLGELHMVLQAAMGWTNSHLHQFMVGKTYYSEPEFDETGELNFKDERKVRVSTVLSTSKRKIRYEYDFGDSWEHEIVLEKSLPRDLTVKYPRCTGGARACPPEDCGGVGGYADFLEAIANPDHEEHDECLEWIGGEFDPDKFDVKSFDDALECLTEMADD
jgi:hypothetical protein